LSPAILSRGPPLIGVPFLRGILIDHRFLFRLVTLLLFYGLCYCHSCCLMDHGYG
jgi:hypothetical protein